MWQGKDTTYEINDNFKKYFTEERILEAVESLKKNRDLFLMPKQIQRKCGAFFIHKSGKTNYRGNINQADVDKLLTTWEIESDTTADSFLENI